MATYQRKTRDEYVIQGYYDASTGWEDVSAESTWKDARIALKEYRLNQPEYPVRCRKHRVPIS